MTDKSRFEKAREVANEPKGKGWQTPTANAEDDVLDQLAESGLTPELVEMMREGRYLTANRCPICKVGRGRWCKGLAQGKVHAERLDNIEEP